MAQRAQQQENLIVRSILVFGRNVASNFARINSWRRHAAAWVERKRGNLVDRGVEHATGLVIMFCVVIWIGLTVWSLGRVKGGVDSGHVAAALLLGAITSAVVSIPLALLLPLLLFLAAWLFKALASVALFLPVIVWTPLYALWQAVIVVAKLLLLIPLFALFVVTRLIQLWRGIFYTCPSRQCVYRGLPIYVCPHCGEGNRKLWPNLYGLLWHHCAYCDAKLPALDRLGRDKLQRRCGGCEMPLDGKHAGRAPERLVAIVGAPSSGKTNYLLMAAGEIVNGGSKDALLRGEIDDHTQADEFAREWRNLAKGIPAAKTSESLKALLLYIRFGREKCQLYLYDAPGEEFASISAMNKQQYFPLLEGFILLVDPLSFESVRSVVGGVGYEALPLQEVVTSTLATATSGAEVGRSGKIAKRVAVVISKADLPFVKEQIGDIKQDRLTSERCRAAIAKWGGSNALNAIEHRFEEVEYFACSPLGRAFEHSNRQPFQGVGVIEPLVWTLSGRRR